MKKIIYALLAVAATLSFASCDNGFNEEAPEIGTNTIAFKLERSGVETRSASTSPVISRQMIPMGDPVDGMNFYLEETVTDLNASYGPETKGTPVYTENFADMFDSFYGVARTSGTSETGTVVLSDGAFVNGGNGVWKREMSSDIYGDGIDELYFYLRAPQTVEGLTDLAYSTYRSGGKTHAQITFKYTPPFIASEQQDIVFAARPVTKDEAKDYVPILFNHMLTGIKFAIANENNDNVETYISQVELKRGFHKSATFTFSSTEESGGWVDDPEEHSSSAPGNTAVSNGNNVVRVTGGQQMQATDSYKLLATPADITPVDFTTGSFGNKGAYPNSFKQKGNEKNLNDSDASMTFWLVPQAVNTQAQMIVTFHVVSAGQDSGPITRTIEIGKLLKDSNNNQVVWRPGELRTYTLKGELLDVDIKDKVNGFEKTDVEITNTGNVDAFIRAHITANWFGYDANNVYSVAVGYKSQSSNEFVTPWTKNDDDFEGLPGDNWYYNSNDGFYYYTKAVPAGTKIPDALFTKYSIEGTTANPIPPAVWYVDSKNTRHQFTGVELVMEIPVQAIEAVAGTGYQAAWAAKGVEF